MLQVITSSVNILHKISLDLFIIKSYRTVLKQNKNVSFIRSSCTNHLCMESVYLHMVNKFEIELSISNNKRYFHQKFALYLQKCNTINNIFHINHYFSASFHCFISILTNKRSKLFINLHI